MVHNLYPARVISHRTSFHPPTAKAASEPAPSGQFQTLLQQQGAAADPVRPSLQNVAALPNGGLMLNPTGNNALTGGTIAYNPNYYATADAAAQLAQQLGGTVVDRRG